MPFRIPLNLNFPRLAETIQCTYIHIYPADGTNGNWCQIEAEEGKIGELRIEVAKLENIVHIA